MMHCNEFERLLHAWLDGELTGADEARMREHAAACPGCAELLTALEAAQEVCEELGPEVDVPETAAMAWRQAVRTEAALDLKPHLAKKRAFSSRRWESWASVAAGLVLLVGGANLVRAGRLYLPTLLAPQSTPQLSDAAQDSSRNDPFTWGEEGASASDADMANALDETISQRYSASAETEGAPQSGASTGAAQASDALGGALAPSAPQAQSEALADFASETVLETEPELEAKAKAEPKHVTETLTLEPQEGPQESDVGEFAATNAETETAQESPAYPLTEFLIDAGLFAALCTPIVLLYWRHRRRKKA